MKVVKYSLRIIDRERLKVQLQWEPHAIWVGCTWQITREIPPPFHILHLFFCILPTVSLHFTILRRDKITRQERAELAAIKLLITNGHTEHCSKRIVWGDGECECGKERTAHGI